MVESPSNHLTRSQISAEMRPRMKSLLQLPASSSTAFCHLATPSAEEDVSKRKNKNMRHKKSCKILQHDLTIRKEHILWRSMLSFRKAPNCTARTEQLTFQVSHMLLARQKKLAQLTSSAYYERFDVRCSIIMWWSGSMVGKLALVCLDLGWVPGTLEDRTRPKALAL